MAQLVQQGVGSSQIDVYQSGYANQHMVWHSDGYSRAEIWQQGWGGQKVADVVQSGSGNMAPVQQMGSGQAAILQSGSNLSAAIMQRPESYGYGNNAMIRQGY